MRCQDCGRSGARWTAYDGPFCGVCLREIERLDTCGGCGAIGCVEPFRCAVCADAKSAGVTPCHDRLARKRATVSRTAPKS